MDFENYSNNTNNSNNFHNNKRNAAMETASFTLGIISILSSTCIYVSIVCGALAIIFAILSKGGATSMSSPACLSLGLGVSGIVFTIIIFSVCFALAYTQYGGINEMMRAIYSQSGLDYDSLMQMLQ